MKVARESKLFLEVLVVEECLMFEERFLKKNLLSDALTVLCCSATSKLSQQESVKRKKKERGKKRETKY